MQNRTPVARAARPALPEFTPVPRQYRHDGWTPERQKAFIEALADTGSVTRAAGMVNIAQRNAYALRRAPGAEEFRRAWDAALDFGVARLKDIAFERAVEGELIPVFQRGELRGFRRKTNDALLMFILRHYGGDASGRKTTISYVSSKAVAGAQGGTGGAAAAAEATVRTISSDRPSAETLAIADDRLAGELSGFAGVTLDATAQAAIAAALHDCAERARTATSADDDPAEHYVPVDAKRDDPFRGTLQPSWQAAPEEIAFQPDGEDEWMLAGSAEPPEIAAAVAQVRAARLAAERADGGPLLPAPAVVADDGVAAVKRPRRRKVA